MLLMNGSQFAKGFVNDYLMQDIPVRIIDYRNGWNASDTELPSPLKYVTYEPIALDEWPTIITVAMSTNGMERIGYRGDNPLYRVDYTMRTYIWVRDIGSAEVTLMRDRMTTVIRSAILDYPCLKAMDSGDALRVQIDEGTLQEQFSDLTLLKGDRVLAGSYLSYNLMIDEVIERRPLGTAETINVTTELIEL
jgi:hypothetical protein